MARKRYTVSVPVLAICLVEVVADSEDQAIDYAVDHATLDKVDAWQAHKILVQDNCFYGDLNEAEIFDTEDLDESDN